MSNIDFISRSWSESISSIFSCCTQQSRGVELLLEETELEESNSSKLLQEERSLELQIIQAEQRLSALNLVRNKTNKTLKEYEEKLNEPKKLATDNAKIIAEKRATISNLQTKETRLSRKLASVKKYHSSLTSELSAIQRSQSNASDSQTSSLQGQIDQEQRKLQEIQSEIRNTNSQTQQLQSQAEKNKTEIGGLTSRIAELKKELEFSENMKSRFGLGGSIPTGLLLVFCFFFFLTNFIFLLFSACKKRTNFKTCFTKSTGTTSSYSTRLSCSCSSS